MTDNNEKKLLDTVIKALDSKRAEDIRLLCIKDITVVADYFIIANGTSNTQTKALADEVEFQLKQNGVEPLRIEGYQTANWIAMDYGSFIVHVFYKETREYYNLERLWNDAEQIDISDLIIKE
ncbi:MAG: ribosome silencing factor [Ruminococcus sp.]|nr:ribosome silencing factor [Ruminococcus sp.]